MFRLAPLGLRLTLVVVVLLCVAFARADEGDTPAIRRVPAYCGIYSVYGALNALGVKCEFADFVSSKYVTSKFGSTIDDLKKAAEDHRAFALAESNLTASDLRDAPCPVVLHVADERRIGVYNHWVLYLGTEDGLARIINAPHELELMPFAELLARWDSIGLFVSDKPIELRRQTARHWLTTMLAVSLAAPVGATAWRGRPARRYVRAPLAAVAIVGSSVLLAVAYHSLAPEGMLRNASAVTLVRQSHMPVSLPEISAEKMAELTARARAVVINARHEDAFERDHIPGAINIPVTASREERRHALRGVAKNTPIVLYCQSDRCAYSDDVGRSLAMDGYENVSVYREGWLGRAKIKKDE